MTEELNVIPARFEAPSPPCKKKFFPRWGWRACGRVRQGSPYSCPRSAVWFRGCKTLVAILGAVPRERHGIVKEIVIAIIIEASQESSLRTSRLKFSAEGCAKVLCVAAAHGALRGAYFWNLANLVNLVNVPPPHRRLFAELQSMTMPPCRLFRGQPQISNLIWYITFDNLMSRCTCIFISTTHDMAYACIPAPPLCFLEESPLTVECSSRGKGLLINKD